MLRNKNKYSIRYRNRKRVNRLNNKICLKSRNSNNWRELEWRNRKRRNNRIGLEKSSSVLSVIGLKVIESASRKG